MMHEFQEQPEHRAIAELMPWYLNGTLGERDRQKVESHVGDCEMCRDELAQERRIHEAMSAEAAVEYIPAASLKRLQARLDALGDDEIDTLMPAQHAPFRGWYAAAASVAIVAVVAALMYFKGWIVFGPEASAPRYHTVTNPRPQAPGEVIRAVFSPTITLVELQAILDEAQLRIVSGPTEAGVYSLAPNSTRPVSSSLALLRRHAAVRFAESIEHQQSDNTPPER
jgi:hypothetical protein